MSGFRGVMLKVFPMKLNDIERRQPLWLNIRNHLESELVILRAKNEGIMDEAHRNYLIGQIAAIKSLIAIGDEREEIKI